MGQGFHTLVKLISLVMLDMGQGFHTLVMLIITIVIKEKLFALN